MKFCRIILSTIVPLLAVLNTINLLLNEHEIIQVQGSDDRLTEIRMKWSNGSTPRNISQNWNESLIRIYVMICHIWGLGHSFFVNLVKSSYRTSGALGQRVRHSCSFLSSLLPAIIQEGGFKTQPSCADGVTAGGTC